MNIPILTYHSANVTSNEYAGNDHVALAEDLRLVTELGYTVVSLDTLLDWHQGLAELPFGKAIAITLDDGTDYDFRDLEFGEHGLQAGMFNILKAFQGSNAAQPGLHATTFVVASPQARSQLDERALFNRGAWNDDWWLEAHQSGLMAVENHGWDHVHPELDRVAQRDQVRADFTAIDSLEDCRAQVCDAQDYLQEMLAGYRPRYFAYPWGKVSDYLAEEFLPHYKSEHQLRAAFTTKPRPVTREDGIWRLPRYVCGRDWRSREDLVSILRACS